MFTTKYSFGRIAFSVFTFLLISIGGFEQTAHAWGCEGHEIVALIAMKQLEAKHSPALQKAVAVLQKSPIPATLHRFCKPSGLPVFADVSTWADDVRDDKTANFHFIDVPLSVKSAIDSTKFCQKGCVVDALKMFQEQFKKPSSTGKDKADALRFLIHFVGDSHQPLHDAMNSDRGGNCVPVKYLNDNVSITPDKKDSTKLEVSPNLHSIWDKSIIDTQLEKNKLSLSAYADKLRMTFQSSAPASAKDAPLVWITTGHDAAETAYSKIGIAVVPNAVNVEKCTHQIVDPLEKKHFAVNPAYVTDETPIVEAQLAKAGFRLAALIEELMK
jgi:nuclease S1